MNIRGIKVQTEKTKVNQLRNLAITANAYIIAVTETWLKDDIVNAEIAIYGYTLYRSDRIVRQRGGEVMYVRSDICVAPISYHSDGNIETLVLKFKSLK